MTLALASHNQYAPRVVMPRFSLQLFFLCWTLCVLWTVRADFADARLRSYQKLLWRQQPARDRSLRFIKGTAEKASTVSCQCEMFVQSWKTSHMIRLPMGMDPIQVNESLLASTNDYCIQLCREKVPSQSSLGAEEKWTKANKWACKAMLENEEEARKNQISNWRSKNSDAPAKGCLQVYARSSVDEIWVPMGGDYRHTITCSSTSRYRRGLTSARKVSESGPVALNSVDAQVVVGQRPSSNNNNNSPSGSVGGITKGPSTSSTSSPSPLRMVLKQFGMTGPFFESVMDIFDRVHFRELLDSFRLGSYVDRYQRYAEDYAEEFDAGHCFLEYMVYTVFNNRFSLKGNSIERSSDGSRGIEDDAIGMIMGAATNLLKSENSSQVLTTLFNMFPTKANKKPSKSSIFAAEDEALAMQNMVPDIKDVALNVARYYLRNYFSSLSGSTVRVDEKDPNNNPDSLADMIEQVSRPVFLSVFGIVPGVPAAGRLDHLLLIANKDKPLSDQSSSSSIIKPLLSNALGSHQTESRNKLVPLEASFTAGGGVSDEPSFIKTGNPFFDFGNRMVATFQRASDATHGLYCVKQYMVNKMWDGFRGTMRRMMRAIPSVG